MVNLSRIDLNLFVVLEAIYAERGITRASEVLNLSQPAISHALARLRDLLGDPLFVREGHTMVATPLTHEIIGPVRRALKEIEGSLNRLHHFDAATSTRQFRLGVRHIVEAATIPVLAARLRARAPLVQLAARHHDRNGLHAALASGELDAAVDVLLPRSTGVVHEHLHGGKLVVVARRGHPRIGGMLDLETYLQEEHVLATPRKNGVGVEDMALERLGRERKIVVRCQHYWTACQVAATSELLFTMPERYAGQVNSMLGNQLHPLPFEAPDSDLFLYWHKTSESDPASVWLRQEIRACFVTQPGPPGAD